MTPGRCVLSLLRLHHPPPRLLVFNPGLREGCGECGELGVGGGKPQIEISRTDVKTHVRPRAQAVRVFCFICGGRAPAGELFKISSLFKRIINPYPQALIMLRSVSQAAAQIMRPAGGGAGGGLVRVRMRGGRGARAPGSRLSRRNRSRRHRHRLLRLRVGGLISFSFGTPPANRRTRFVCNRRGPLVDKKPPPLRPTPRIAVWQMVFANASSLQFSEPTCHPPHLAGPQWRGNERARACTPRAHGGTQVRAHTPA